MEWSTKYSSSSFSSSLACKYYQENQHEKSGRTSKVKAVRTHNDGRRRIVLIVCGQLQPVNKITNLTEVDSIVPSSSGHLLIGTGQINKVLVEILAIVLHLRQAITGRIHTNEHRLHLDLVLLCRQQRNNLHPT
jgi:hypothetical protein